MSDTISLQLAKRFKEAGIKIWTQSLNWLYYPTSEELWDMLPESIENKNQKSCPLHLCLQKLPWWTNVLYRYIHASWLTDRLDWRKERKRPTLAESLGEMYIYLFTNGLIWKGKKPE